jgi:hypothetical protein
MNLGGCSLFCNQELPVLLPEGIHLGSPQITGTLDKLTSITRVRQVTYRA